MVCAVVVRWVSAEHHADQRPLTRLPPQAGTPPSSPPSLRPSVVRRSSPLAAVSSPSAPCLLYNPSASHFDASAACPLTGQRIIGSMGTSRGAAREQMFSMVEHGRLRPGAAAGSATPPYSGLESFMAAFGDVAARRAIGKIVISVNGDDGSGARATARL